MHPKSVNLGRKPAMIIKKVLLILITCTIPIISVHGDEITATSQAMQKCITNNSYYINRLLDTKTERIVQVTDQTKEAVRNYAIEAFAQTVLEKCAKNIPDFLDEADKTITYTYTSKTEAEDGSDLVFYIGKDKGLYVKDILNSIITPVGIVFWPKTFSIPDTLIVTKEKAKELKTFINDRCSAPNPGWNVGNDTVINKAGQSVFNQNNEEYFIDNDPYAFTGLLMEDVYGTSENRIMYYANILTAYEKAKDIANKINEQYSGVCTGLNAYIVALYAEKGSIKQHSASNEYSGGDEAQYGFPITFGSIGAVTGGLAAAGVKGAVAIGAFFGLKAGTAASWLTFGLSIPIGAAIGAGIGFAVNKLFTWDVSADIKAVAVLSHAIPVR